MTTRRELMRQMMNLDTNIACLKDAISNSDWHDAIQYAESIKSDGGYIPHLIGNLQREETLE